MDFEHKYLKLMSPLEVWYLTSDNQDAATTLAPWGRNRILNNRLCRGMGGLDLCWCWVRSDKFIA